MRKEGFRRVHELHGVDEIEAATVGREKSWTDLRELTGPFDIVGDVHGCASELRTLLAELGWQLELDDAGLAVGAAHPEGRTAVFVGDLVDRGPDTPGVLRLVMGMVAAGTALCVSGNHEAKLVRALRGAKVKVAHGLAESLDQLAAQPEEFRDAVLAFMDGLISHYVLDDGGLVVAHAGLKEAYHGRASGRVRSFALYGDTTGETDEFGLPVRYPWAREYRGRAMVVYGHTPVPEAEWVNNTICLDTGVVFGGTLTALRYPERELVSVPAEQQWYEPARPLVAAGRPSERVANVLHIDDVAGTRWLETAYAGKVKIPEENAAAALEIMSRFAVDPRWLVYLPPTMAPSATSQREGFLEHPEEAFAEYAAAGSHRGGVRGEAHGLAGGRRDRPDAAVAEARFGLTDGTSGVVYTRTGRSFFDDTAPLVDGLRAAAGPALRVAGHRLARHRLRAAALVGQGDGADPRPVRLGRRRRPGLAAGAGRAARQAAARGLEVGDLTDRTRPGCTTPRRSGTPTRRTAGPTSGLDGVTLAPFQILAAEGRALAVTEPHAWHLDQLAALDGTADHADPAPVRRPLLGGLPGRGGAWWLDLTADGGEGMVVKPARAATADLGRGVQPGLKVRGREYLRIIYGPDYLESSTSCAPATSARSAASRSASTASGSTR